MTEALPVHTKQQRPAAAPARQGRAWVRNLAKAVAVGCGMIVIALPAALCRLEARFAKRNECFLFLGQSLGLVPGLPGKYLRKCFYFLTLKACDLDCEIGFLSHFLCREAILGPRVYVGSGVSLGRISIGAGSLIGSRVSFLNGGQQHHHGSDGCLVACDWTKLPWLHVGEETWIGEAAIVMSDVGRQCIVSAGCVVSSQVPDGCVVGGNPMRFIRRSMEQVDRQAAVGE